MDKQEAMQFVGFLGCFKESIKIISSVWKIFTKITLTLILPLSLIFLLFHIEISNILLRKIKHNEAQFKLIYLTVVLHIFSPLSISAVDYATASIYTTKDAITFKKIMSVVPKVWERLIVTICCAVKEFCCYTAVTFAVSVLLTWFFAPQDRESGVAMVLAWIMIVILYVNGVVYLTLIWQLACVVTVLEDSYEEIARVKSKELIKGKMGLSLFIFWVIDVGFVLVWFLFNVVMVETTAYGILIPCFLLLLSCLILFALVLQTVLYFVCKSYHHHESIDKSA